MCYAVQLSMCMRHSFLLCAATFTEYQSIRSLSRTFLLFLFLYLRPKAASLRRETYNITYYHEMQALFYTILFNVHGADLHGKLILYRHSHLLQIQSHIPPSATQEKSSAIPSSERKISPVSCQVPHAPFRPVSAESHPLSCTPEYWLLES